MLVARAPAEVAPLLAELETAAAQGLWAAGFLAYEAAAAFGLPTREPIPGLPLAWFGLYAEPEAQGAPVPNPSAVVDAPAWVPALQASDHARIVAALQERIAAGDTYQVNFTFPLRTSFAGSAFSLFGRLRQAQRAAHAAFVDTGRFAVCSASPELFFRWEAGSLLTRPMKGTAARGPTAADDDALAFALQSSAKDRAENLMIVDMLRNDLGRVATAGSVAVPDLFRIERYPTLLQMTSTVTARTSAGFASIVEALFPCASITGAPKFSTMGLIAEAEAAPRGVYTGAIGFLAPDRRACFNVAIRTVVVDREKAEATYGIGSGIVADSVAASEHAECLLKARVVVEAPFRLLETMRFSPGEGIFLEEEHLDRLTASAAHFGGAVDRRRVEEALRELASGLSGATRVRLLVDLDGGITVEAHALDAPGADPVRVALAIDPVDESSPWLFHKTTRREVYDAALAARPEADEVILWNRRGEVTEGTRHNLVLELGGERVTPPVSGGLLAGTFRRHLLATGQVRERVVTVAETRAAEHLFVVNSVVGWREAHWLGDPST